MRCGRRSQCTPTCIAGPEYTHPPIALVEVAHPSNCVSAIRSFQLEGLERAFRITSAAYVGGRDHIAMRGESLPASGRRLA
jgi:hypothetical protein